MSVGSLSGSPGLLAASESSRTKPAASTGSGFWELSTAPANLKPTLPDCRLFPLILSLFCAFLFQSSKGSRVQCQHDTNTALKRWRTILGRGNSEVHANGEGCKIKAPGTFTYTKPHPHNCPRKSGRLLS